MAPQLGGLAEFYRSPARDHVINTSAAGLLTIAGGKWTTYRKMALDTVDAAIRLGGLSPSGPSRTEATTLVGGAAIDPLGSTRLVKDYQLGADSAKHLHHSYGDQAREVLHPRDCHSLTAAMRSAMTAACYDLHDHVSPDGQYGGVRRCGRLAGSGVHEAASAGFTLACTTTFEPFNRARADSRLSFSPVPRGYWRRNQKTADLHPTRILESVTPGRGRDRQTAGGPRYALPSHPKYTHAFATADPGIF
jgi:hypothetical protein